MVAISKARFRPARNLRQPGWPLPPRMTAALFFSSVLHLIFISLPFQTSATPVSLPSLIVSLPALQPRQAREEPIPVSTSTAQAEISLPGQDARIKELTPSRQTSTSPHHETSHSAYFPVSELTRKPRLLIDLEELSWRLPPQAHGMVILTLYLSDKGEIDNIEFDSPVTSEIHDWIRDTLSKSPPFSPGERYGMPVPSRLKIELILSGITR